MVALLYSTVSRALRRNRRRCGEADRYGVPRICLINKMDRTGADFENSVESIRERLQAKPLVLHLPLGCEADFRGIIDLYRRESMGFPRGGEPVTIPIPAEERGQGG